MLDMIFNKYENIIILESIVANGTLFHNVLEYKELKQYKSKVFKHSFDINEIITYGSVNDLYDHYGFSDEDLINMIKGVEE